MQLQLSEVCKQYNKDQAFALDYINLRVEKGEFISILGLSGSGKSTLVRCVNRLIEPTKGKIFFEGADITALRREDLRQYRKNIAMIFQQYNLIPRMDVLTNVLVGRFGSLSALKILLNQFPEEDLYRAQLLLNQVGLGELGKRQVKTLSGGQQQRVGIARALIQGPKIILGDEPVSSLDPVTAHEIMSLLKEINEKSQITMVINLHSVELAKCFAKRIIGIHQGKIVFDGPPALLKDEEVHRIYKGVLL